MTSVFIVFLQDDDDDDDNDANLSQEISDNPEFIISSEEDNDDGDETDIYADDNEQVRNISFLKNTQTLSHIPTHYRT